MTVVRIFIVCCSTVILIFKLIIQESRLHSFRLVTLGDLIQGRRALQEGFDLLRKNSGAGN